MTTTKIATGLMAFGMSGKVFHAPFLHAHPDFVLEAVVERSAKNAANTYPEVSSYNSVKELLSDDKIQLVVVNTPNNLHFEHAKAALLAGKHVLIEKPVTVTVGELEELWAIADSRKLQVMAYQNRRWDTDFLSVKRVIESGKLGKLVEVHFRYDRYKATPGVKAFKESWQIPGSGLVYDLGPHLLDQVISLFGPPVSVDKVVSTNREHSEVSDYFSYRLRFETGLIATVTASLLVAAPLPSFVLHGTKGTYVKERADVQEAQLVAGLDPRDSLFAHEPTGKEGELTTFREDGSVSKEMILSPESNYLQLFDAVYQQIVEGVPYPIKREELRWQLELL